MGLFKRKERVIDWSEKYREEQKFNEMMNKRKSSQLQETQPTSITPESETSNPFAFFGNNPTSSSYSNESESSDDSEEGLSVEERKRRLGKRLLDMTNKIEDLSNQIYHLQQRIEYLERKTGSSSSDESNSSYGY